MSRHGERTIDEGYECRVKRSSFFSGIIPKR